VRLVQAPLAQGAADLVTPDGVPGHGPLEGLEGLVDDPRPGRLAQAGGIDRIEGPLDLGPDVVPGSRDDVCAAFDETQNTSLWERALSTRGRRIAVVRRVSRLVGPNDTRTKLTIRTPAGGGILYIDSSESVSTFTGYPIFAGESLSVNRTDAVYCIFDNTVTAQAPVYALMEYSVGDK
jgi:hypothetical protein